MKRNTIILLLSTLLPWTLHAETPADLVGQFLYFEEGPEDYLVFDNPTNGEERDLLGDVDPFTYTYSITGATTATLVATYDVGEYDEWNLTWDGAGTGTFVRNEYKDDLLEDTDTGRFVENSGSSSPPSELVGSRLEEAVELEDERFEFLTATEGREFEPGDIDPFTYVYTPVDSTTATILATFKVDKFDDLTLSFETATTGTYVLDRHDDGVLKDQKRGQFRLDLNTQTVDVLIGDDKGGLSGDNIFNQSGRNQTETVRINNGRPVRLRTEIENDGDDDSITARASRGSRKFDTRFYTANPRQNVTAGISGRGISLGEIEHDEGEIIEIEARRRGKGRGRNNGWVQGSSDDIAGAEDRGRFKLIGK